jgi:Flp pilus assembly pilin Flp
VKGSNGSEPSRDLQAIFDHLLKEVKHYMFIAYMRSLLEQLRNEEGQTAVEYALVLALIAVVIVGVVATGLTAAAGDIIDEITAGL